MSDACRFCGAWLKTYDVTKDGEVVGEEVVCPNEWHEGHT